MFDIVTIGGATLDIFFQSSQFKLIEKDGSTALCEMYNEKLDVENAEISSGGAATNVAVALAKLGFSSSCITEIGDDVAGQTVMKDLTDAKVDVSQVVKVPGENTAISALLISQDGARTALVYRGASRMLEGTDVKWDTLQTKWIHLSSVGNAELITRTLTWCKEHQVPLSWNPGNWELERIKSGELKPDLSAVHVLFINRKEAGMVLGKDLTQESDWKSEWCIVGPHISIVTDGKNGGKYCVDGKCSEYSAKEVSVVQETGAGDAFASGCIAGLLKGKTLVEAIEMGKEEAAAVVQQMGAKKGLLSSIDLANPTPPLL